MNAGILHPLGGPMNARTLLLAAAQLTLAAACADAPVAPTSLTAAGPSLDFANGPDNLPNVMRFRDAFAFGVGDPKTDLLAFAGLPDDPASFIGCGGSEPFAEANVQISGVRQEVIHWLQRTSEINLDVYDFTTFQNICVSTPIASGVGHAWYVDNDRDVSGTGANSWGFHMGGEVTLSDGTTANLEAHNRFIIWPNGDFRRIHRQVRLSR